MPRFGLHFSNASPTVCGRSDSASCREARMVRFAPAVLATVIATAAISAQDRDDPNKSIDRVLAVQAALYQGRQHLLKGDAKQAVAALEAELSNSNGNRDYL